MIKLSDFLMICDTLYDEIEIIELKEYTTIFDLVKSTGTDDDFKLQFTKDNNILRKRTYIYNLINIDYQMNANYFDNWVNKIKELEQENLYVVFFENVSSWWYEELDKDILKIYCVKNNIDKEDM